ncbi:hypothetical protein APF79_14515 [bacterium BRH_c32]|nr:MAG: hypothetical protein APF79_14515 [bacterium BRH_c32]
MSIYKNKLILILILLVVLSNSFLAQVGDYDEVIADINGDKITASLFQELWEMSPHLESGNINNSLSAKINFLNTIMAYKLWYHNREEYNFDDSSAYFTAVGEIEKMYVRDALYRTKILDKIKIDSLELTNGIEKEKRTLEFNYIIAKDEEEIRNVYKLLNLGVPFELILSAREENSKQTEPIQIKFGDYPELTENELFSMAPNTFSNPIKFSDGYYLFYLRNVIKKIWISEEEEKKELQTVQDIIKKRKETLLLDSFMKDFLNKKKADVNRILFKKLENNLIEAFAKKTAEEGANYISLSIDEFLKIENKFTKAELESNFISFESDTLKFGKYLRALYFNGIKMPAKDSLTVAASFDRYIRSYIEGELLYKEGIKEKLLYVPEVQKYLKMWREYYSFETIRDGMLDDEKMRFQITKKTAEYALKSNIKVNYEALKRIELTRINSTTIRYFGFGGSLSGVPIYTPNYEWTERLELINAPL